MNHSRDYAVCATGPRLLRLLGMLVMIVGSVLLVCTDGNSDKFPTAPQAYRPLMVALLLGVAIGFWFIAELDVDARRKAEGYRDKKDAFKPLARALAKRLLEQPCEPWPYAQEVPPDPVIKQALAEEAIRVQQVEQDLRRSNMLATLTRDLGAKPKTQEMKPGEAADIGGGMMASVSIGGGTTTQ